MHSIDCSQLFGSYLLVDTMMDNIVSFFACQKIDIVSDYLSRKFGCKRDNIGRSGGPGSFKIRFPGELRLLANDNDLLRSADPQLDTVLTRVQHFDLDIVADHDPVADPPTDYEHVAHSRSKGWRWEYPDAVWMVCTPNRLRRLTTTGARRFAVGNCRERRKSDRGRRRLRRFEDAGQAAAQAPPTRPGSVRICSWSRPLRG